MYNNFSSKKTKKVISALLASALVVTAAPITADAATTKVLGVSKTFSIAKKASAKVSGLSKAEKNIVKVTISKNKKKVTVKGKKAGSATFKVGSKSYTVRVTKVTSIKKKTFATTLTAKKNKNVSVTVNGTNVKYDTVTWTSSNKKVVTVKSASTKVSSKKVASNTLKPLKKGTATITVKSKATGKSLKVKVTVKAATATATPATPTTTPTSTPSIAPSVTPATTPAVSATPEATATVTPATTPAVSATPEATATPSADVTTTPAITATPSADVTTTPVITATPSADVTTTPAITATPSAVEFAVTQTGEKKITITNPTPFTKADVKVKRGNSDVTIDSIQLDENATTAVVTLAGSIVATNYTVSVGDSSTTFTGVASEVAKIEVTSEFAPILGEIGGSSANDKKAIATYVVYNQFNENVTAKTSLTANTSAKNVTLNPTDGTMTIEWEAAPRLNDVVSVVLMYQQSGISTSKILTVQTKAAPAEIEVKGIYNADGKTLTATNVDKESFYFLYRVKDQYGNYMGGNDIIETGTNPNMFTNVSPAMTNVTLGTGSSRQTLTVDGVNYLAYPVILKEDGKAANSGEVTVMLIPGGSGKTITTTFKVENGSTVKSFNVVVDGSVAAGGKKNLTYVALDENGDEVKEYRVLKDVKTGNAKFYWQKANGKVNLVFDDSKGDNGASTAGTVVSAVFTLPSYETRLVSVNIGEAAVPASISGIDSSVALATRKNAADSATNKVEIPFSKLKICDQYGNSIKTISFAKTAARATNGELGVMLVAEDNNNETFNAVTGLYEYDDKTGVSVIGTEEAFNIVANDKDQLGTESFTLKLVKFDAANDKWVDYESNYTTSAKTNFTQTGAFTTTLTVTENKKFVSYDVNTIDKVFDVSTANAGHSGFTASVVNDATAFEKEVTVYGVINGGAKVKLVPGTDFKVVAGTNTTLSGTNKITVNATEPTYLTDKDTVEGTYQVVINHTGETVDKKVTISKEMITSASLKLDNDLEGINLPANTFNQGATFDAKTLLANIVGKDSYGNDLIIDKTVNVGEVSFKGLDGTKYDEEQIIITASDLETKDGEVADNGTATPTFTGFVAGDSFTATFTVGKATFSTVVSIQEAEATANAPVAKFDIVKSNATDLYIGFSEELCSDAAGTVLNDTYLQSNAGTMFSVTGTGTITVGSCEYVNGYIHLVLSGAVNGDVINIVANKLYDKEGHPVAAGSIKLVNATSGTWSVNQTAPTASLKVKNSNATKVVIAFDEALYTSAGVAITDTEAAAAFTLTTADVSDNSALTASDVHYDANTKTITVTIPSTANVDSNDTLVLGATSLYDASGNAVATATYKATVTSGVTTWAVQP